MRRTGKVTIVNALLDMGFNRWSASEPDVVDLDGPGNRPSSVAGSVRLNFNAENLAHIRDGRNSRKIRAGAAICPHGLWPGVGGYAVHADDGGLRQRGATLGRVQGARDWTRPMAGHQHRSESRRSGQLFLQVRLRIRRAKSIDRDELVADGVGTV